MKTLVSDKRQGRNSAEVQIDKDEIQALVDRYHAKLGGLIAILQEIQAIYGYLPEGALREVAATTHRSLVDIYGVATFYRSFSLRPRGRHHLCACLGTACHVRGGAAVVEELERQLKIRSGETTRDGEFSLETVNCLGACALGPIVVADGIYHTKVDAASVKRILRKLQTEPEPMGSEPKVAVSR